MIQLNLLPSVKQEYLSARRTRQLVTLISFTVGAAALTILVLLLVSVKIIQQKSMKDADADINAYSRQLKAIPDIDKILTVQNQMNTLTGLHDQKVVSSRIFGYLKLLTPNTTSLNSLDIDYTANTLSLSGKASALDQVNAYADILKQTTFKTTEDDTSKAAFSGVVLSSFSRDDKGVTFTITLTFDPAIFASSGTPTLTVPRITTDPQQQLFQSKVGQ